MAWVTAFLEAFTIQGGCIFSAKLDSGHWVCQWQLEVRVFQLYAGFPYYAIEDREHLYTAGSVIYGLYFVVSFVSVWRRARHL